MSDPTKKVEKKNSTASNSAQIQRRQIVDEMCFLESALAAASFDRIPRWLDEVQDKLLSLQSVLAASRVEINSKQGLFGEIIEDHPRMIPRINKLTQTYDDLERQIESLKNEFQRDSEPPEVSDVRERLSWLLNAMRHIQARETELIFEAIGRDIGVGD